MKYFYIFVRQDIPIAQQIVQTNHATLEMSKLYPVGTEVPYIVLIGVPNWEELVKIKEDLKNKGIKFAEFHDTDFDFGTAAVVTVPLGPDERKLLRHHALWKECVKL